MKTLRTKNENEKNGRSSNCLKSSTSGYNTEETGDDEENLSLLMDEAKTMMKVGEYHEYIVNLQGITVKLQDNLTYQVILFVNNRIEGYSFIQGSRISSNNYPILYLDVTDIRVLCSG